MHKKGIISWSIIESSDLPLNFALFTGCSYGLIEDTDIKGERRLWPPKCMSNQSDKSLLLLKKQWKEWFHGLIYDRGEKVILRQDFDFTNNMFNPPDFVEFPYKELSECCKNAWQPFNEWWFMAGGGKNALSYLERVDDQRIYHYISEFETKVNRTVKPFHLYIDLVYTGTEDIIEVNNEYIVMVPHRAVYTDKEWWINKLSQIG